MYVIKSSFRIVISYSVIDYRVHWLRARAHANRWAEELKLTHHEMDWTARFFIYKAREWIKCKDRVLQDSNVIGTPYMRGAVAYAARQIHFWQAMGQRAEMMFRDVNVNYRTIQ
jgi:hypothetical protein